MGNLIALNPERGRPGDDTPTPVAINLGAAEPRERAYALWSTVCQRDATKTASMLGLHPRAVQRWAKDGNWRHRFDAERADWLIDVRAVAAVVLAEELLPALATLRHANRGVDDAGNEVKISKERLAAALAVIDRMGMTPVQRSVQTHVTGQPAPVDDLSDLAELTTEQKVERLRRLQAGDGGRGWAG